MIATTRNNAGFLPPAENAAEKSRNYVRRHWKYTEPNPPSAGRCCESDAAHSSDSFSNFLDRIQGYSLCISGMAFQDVWNIDLDRLQHCCVHVATDQDRLIPFCAYYLTDHSGRRLMDSDISQLLK